MYHLILSIQAMKTLFFTPMWMFFSTIGLTHGFLPNKNVQYMINGAFPTIKRDLSNIMMGSMSRKKQPLICADNFPLLDQIDVLKSAAGGKKTKHIKSFGAKTNNQQKYIDLMREDVVDIIIAIGPAGTGKTLLACYAAVEALRLKKIGKIVITRPVVSVDEEIGFLPGGLESKMDPWTRPIFDALRETYSAKEIDTMMEEGVIEIVPLGFMRGRTFKNAWIIADEMQNSTPTQMFMLATRIGEGSKMVITGDLNQSDLDGPNGLHEIHEKIGSGSGSSAHLKMIVLEMSDVQRSRAAKAVLKLYEQGNESSFSEANNSGVEETSQSLPEIQQVLEEVVTSAIISHLNSAKLSHCVPLEENQGLETPVIEAPSDVEWVDLNNDAAMMPKSHAESKYYQGPTL